jgi:hypothetical protein
VLAYSAGVKKQLFVRGLLGTFVLWGAGIVALRAVVVPAEICPAVTAESALTAAQASAAWIAHVQQPDGSYLYEYNEDTNLVSNDYNVVRHAGVTMAMFMDAAQTGDQGALATGDEGLSWMTQNLARYSDWAALQDPRDNTIELGSSALMLAALAQRRLATQDTSNDALMHELARFMLVMQQPDGSFLLSWLPSTGAPDPTKRSPYATGEAFWALTLMQQAFPNEDWKMPARKVADYVSNDRDRVEQQKYPPWADQWSAYALAQMADWPLDESNIRYARSLAERFGFLVRVESQRRDNWFSTLLHGPQSRAAGMATWVEALDSLWRLAGKDSRMTDMRPKLAERAACGAGMLVDRQTSAADAASKPRPDLDVGAWFRDGVTRMDDQQHALSGLLRSRQILDSTIVASN